VRAALALLLTQPIPGPNASRVARKRAPRYDGDMLLSIALSTSLLAPRIEPAAAQAAIANATQTSTAQASGPLDSATRAPALPHPRRVTHVVHAYAHFSPDDAELVYQSNANGDWDLFVSALDGSAVRPIVRGPGADITPVFSPDGAQVLFVSERDGQREVYVCARDGSAQTRLTRDPAHDLHPVWSADGARILFSSNRGNASADDYDLYAMRADGSELRQITRGPDVDTYGSWSPDGQRIVTRRVRAGTNDNEVYVLDADGSNARNLTNDAATYDGWPVWSPDGTRIAYAGGGPPGRSPHRIFLVDVDGKNRVALTGPWLQGGFVYDTQPCFSHAGDQLVFTRYRAGERELSELCLIDVPARV
jgi:Tol biopolymer transport system component